MSINSMKYSKIKINRKELFYTKAKCNGKHARVNVKRNKMFS